MENEGKSISKTFRQNKKAVEDFYIQAFIDWHRNAFRSSYKVIERPDPPDAIIQSKTKTSWIEISEAYWNSDWAQDINTYAASDQEYKPMSPGVKGSMDAAFANNLVGVISRKLSNNNYAKAFEKHGKGYLVVGIRYPFAIDSYTRFQIDKALASNYPIKNLGHFRRVMIARSLGDNVEFWRW